MEANWTAVSLRLKELISPDNFELWFRPLQEQEIDGKTIRLAAPDDYHRMHVLKTYASELKQAVESCAPGYAVDIVVSPAAETKPIPIPTPAPAAVKSPRTTAERPLLHPLLEARYTFDTFVRGSSNDVAHASAEAVAKAPGRTFNPLFIAGAAGLGKTHLLNAIGHAVYRTNPRMRVHCLPAGRFINEYVSAIQRNAAVEFKEKYRQGCDLLLIDDVHSLAGKEGTQEEFFHIFNSLHESGHQIVLTSDKYPREMTGMEQRLRSRFEWGLIADIQPPDIETKLAIIRKKAEAMEIEIEDDVAYFLVELPTASVRDLEGYLVRIKAFSKFQNKKITYNFVQEVLAIHMGQTKSTSVEEIIRVVSEFHNVRPSDLKSASRKASLTTPRHIAMYIARELTALSFPELGQRFGNRNHATVIHACDRVRERMQSEPHFAAIVNALMKSLQ